MINLPSLYVYVLGILDPKLTSVVIHFITGDPRGQKLPMALTHAHLQIVREILLLL